MDQTDKKTALPSVVVPLLRADYQALVSRAERMGVDPDTLAGQYIAQGLARGVGR
ncbi:hypothetical protein GKE82_05830 [Conexibacter sp. W3-3-2]|uniref:hypothetical protein n=1 Tax=Conexibacter sp. W3-3-2 TaxID=2675227 RepID=UPI0012B77B36|nr:hypothetical protein [Conexibacter sp. W3-3-2]MTD43835.1 hypothetical protein [Conexibacter sp. W3-3-2]